MKRIGILALIAIASATLIADRSVAAPKSSWSPAGLSNLLGDHGDDDDQGNVNSLFNAVGLTATSYSVSSGSLTLEAKGAPGADKGKRLGLVLPTHVVGISLGPKNEIVGIKLDPIRPVTSRPIPEARTILLYGLGSLAIAWALLRSRRSSNRAA